jgi:hypothetical protein
MIRTLAVGSAMALLAIACAPQQPATPEPDHGLRCQPSPEMPLEGRASPYDSATVALAGTTLKICYGRPSARGRTMIGGEHVPYGELWRTGANEPTIVHTPIPIAIAGVHLDPGSYSLYTIPDPERWTVILNASTGQWGHESRYTGEVAAQEVGRGMVTAERPDAHVETFTIRGEPADGDRAFLVLEWERTRVRIPIEAH